MKHRSFLVFGLLTSLATSGCATVAQSAANKPAPKTGWEGVEMRLRALSPANLSDYPIYALRGLDKQDKRVTYVARVPLPSYALEISNTSDEPIFLDKLEAWVEGDNGVRFSLLTDRGELVRRTLEEDARRHPFLKTGRLEIERDRERDPSQAIAAAARTLPVLGVPDVAASIPPHYNWNGAVVIGGDAEQLEKWRGLEIGSVLKLRMMGLRNGEQAMTPAELSMTIMHPLAPHVVQCGDGREVPHPKDCGAVDDGETVLNGSCVQENVLSASVMGRPIIAPFIGGRVATTTDVTQTLISDKETRKTEHRAWGLRVGGWSLFAIGLFGAGATTGSLAASGHEPNVSIRGLAFLPLALVGITMSVVAQKQHQKAVQSFNQIAFNTGLCPDPRSTAKRVESKSQHDRPGDWIGLQPGVMPGMSAGGRR